MPQIIRFPQSNRAFKAWDRQIVPTPTGAGFRLRFASIANDSGGRRGNFAFAWWRGNTGKFAGAFEFNNNNLEWISGNTGFGEVQLVSDGGRLHIELVCSTSFTYRDASFWQMEFSALQSVSGAEPTIRFEDPPVEATTGTVVSVIPDKAPPVEVGIQIGETLNQALLFGMPVNPSLQSYPPIHCADITGGNGFVWGQDFLPVPPDTYDITPSHPTLASMTENIYMDVVYSLFVKGRSTIICIKTSIMAGGQLYQFVENVDKKTSTSPNTAHWFNFTVRVLCKKSDNYNLSFGFKLGYRDSTIDQFYYTDVTEQAVWDGMRLQQGVWARYAGKA